MKSTIAIFMRVAVLTAVILLLSAAATSACNGTVVVHVFNDLNGNGAPDAGEPGVAGAVVQASIVDPQGTFVLTATTDNSGNATFDPVLAGTSIFHPLYHVQLVSRDGQAVLSAPDQAIHCVETLHFSIAVVQSVPAMSRSTLALLALTLAAMATISVRAASAM